VSVLTLGKKDFKKGDSYWSDYVGRVDLSTKYEGHIEIEGGLGWVKFDRLWADGNICIEAGEGIKSLTRGL